MYQIGVGFQGVKSPLKGKYVTARGLHGVLYHVLKQHNVDGAVWLHQHDTPKPYNLAPYYDETGVLAGVRVGALTKQTADLLYDSWLQVKRHSRPLWLGQQSFYVSDIACVPGTTFAALAACPPTNIVRLRFLSPTTFRQGPGHLPFPVPTNVFQWPYRVWNAFAPSHLHIPTDWLDWCHRHVFVVQHKIETATIALGHKIPSLTGFVGDVWFESQSDALLYLSLFQGLANLAMYSGVGYKTTMGMGAVETLS